MSARRWLVAGCAALVAIVGAALALVLLIVSPPAFFRLVALGGIALTLLSAVAMVAAARKAATVSIGAQAVSIAVSLVSVIVFAWLLGVRVSLLAWFVAPLAGSLLGALWSFTTRLSLEDGQVRRRGNVLTLVVWTGLFVLQQALATALGRVPATGMVLLLLGTGIVVGQSVTLVARMVYLRSTAA